jgi:hypothetical protein
MSATAEVMPQRLAGYGITERQSLVLSLSGCALITSVFLAFYGDVWHWFLVPTFFCGVLMGLDLADWARGKVDVYDPVALIAVLGFHHFFLAPLLHVALDQWVTFLEIPPDRRGLLGLMAILNMIGLIAYRIFRRASDNSSKPLKRRWTLDNRFPLVISAALVISAVMQVYVYSRFGGIGGYVDAFEEGAENFQGMGWIFAISESFPILLVFALAIFAHRRGLGKTMASLVVMGVVILAIAFLFGGLKGSRSHTIFLLIWSFGVLHLLVRPIPRKVIVGGGMILLLFLYVYGLYKGGGVDALSSLGNSEARVSIERETNRDFEGVLLGDLSRAGTQAHLLYRMTKNGSDYRYRWGGTYVGGAAILIPKSIWPNRPPPKVVAGTEALYGNGTYVEGKRVSSRIYALAGEAMLNFGPLAVPLAFAFWGFAVGRIRALRTRLKDDSRMLMYPLLVLLALTLFFSDSDNIVFMMFKYGLFPFLAVLFSSRRRTPAAQA